MIEMMDIPEVVKIAARELIDLFGDHIVYMGQYNGYVVYRYQFSDNNVSGFPFIYLLDEVGEVRKVTGFKALEILDSLRRY